MSEILVADFIKPRTEGMKAYRDNLRVIETPRGSVVAFDHHQNARNEYL